MGCCKRLRQPIAQNRELIITVTLRVYHLKYGEHLSFLSMTVSLEYGVILKHLRDTPLPIKGYDLPREQQVELGLLGPSGF